MCPGWSGGYKEGLCSTEAPGAGLLQQSPQQDGERHGGLDHRLGGIWLCLWSASPGKLLIWVQIPNTDTLLLCPHRNLLEKGKWSLKWDQSWSPGWFPGQGPAEGGACGKMSFLSMLRKHFVKKKNSLDGKYALHFTPGPPLPVASYLPLQSYLAPEST